MHKVKYIGLTTFAFVAFALAVFFLEGAEPPLVADQLEYFRTAEVIRRTCSTIFPETPTSYWRFYTDNQGLPVVLAYLYPITHSYILACRLLLALLTVLYLWTAWLFVSIITERRWERTLYAMVSAVYVSYGFTFWGFTIFLASLSRSFVIPLFLPCLWLLIKYESNWLRLLLVPLLIYATLLHLSVLHFWAAIFAFECLTVHMLAPALRWKRVAALVAIVPISVCVIWHLSTIPASSFGSELRRLRIFEQSIGPGHDGGRSSPVIETTKQVHNAAAVEQATKVSLASPTEKLPVVSAPVYLSAHDAWEVELTTMRWRNFPFSLATIAQIVASLGFIAPMALLGSIAALKVDPRKEDLKMCWLAVAVLSVGILPQAMIWFVRHFVEIYPINSEEIRIIALFSIPLFYFCFRLSSIIFERRILVRLPLLTGGTVLFLYCLQPIDFSFLLPKYERTRIFDFAVRSGFLDTWDSPRTLYARQVFGIETGEDRFYYSVRDVNSWLAANGKPGERVLAHRPDLALSGLKLVGSSTGFVLGDNRTTNAKEWELEMKKFHQAIANHDLVAIMAVARATNADYIVVPWIDKSAVYKGRYYSVLLPNKQ